MKSLLPNTNFHSKKSHLLISCILILLYFHLHSGLSIFNPSCVNWLLNDSELTVFFFGWDFFRHEPWRFPLGHVENYFYPLGTNIYMFDIPLMALILKPLSPILPKVFQYVGIWLLINHVLQAWFAILLCDRFGLKGLTRLLATIFFIFSPVLLYRFIHPTLYVHWIILASLWIYFLDPAKASLKRILLYQSILLFISALVFVYVWLMVLGFTVALLLRLWLADKKIKSYSALLILFSSNVITVFLWWLIGLISFGGESSFETEGWGEVSLNLNSFFNPINTSPLLPTLPYFPPQFFEGYAYLGAGILLLIVILIVVWIVSSIKKNTAASERIKLYFSLSGINIVPLILFLVFCFLYALSSKITFNQHILFQYELKGLLLKVANSVRASGRFGWSVYYFLFLLVFYSFSKIQIKAVYKNSILLACLLIQLYDLQFFFRPIEVKCETFKPSISTAWETLIKSFDQTIFYPGYARSYLSDNDYKYFAYYASMHRKKINIGYLARFDQKKAAFISDQLDNQLSATGVEDKTLHVTLPAYLNRLIIPIQRNEVFCLDIDGYIAIFKKNEANQKLVESIISNGQGKEITSSILQTAIPTIYSETVTPSNDIKSGIYKLDNTPNHFYVKGWAFLEGSTDHSNDSLFVLLESGQKYLIASAYRFGSSDVASFYNNPELSNIGFAITLSNAKLKDGNYRIGLMIYNNTTHHRSIQWLDQFLVKDVPIKPVFISNIPEYAQPIRSDIYLKADTLTQEIQIDGWAFPEGGACKSCRTYLTLSSARKNYALEYNRFARKDVVDFFKDSTLLYSGVKLRFKKNDLEPGTYLVGLMMIDTLKKVDYYSGTDKIIKTRVSEFAKPELLSSAPSGNDKITATFDAIENKDSFIEIKGWAFLDKVPTQYSKTNIVLKSGDKYYQMTTEAVYRPDVRDYLKLSFKADWTGFDLRFQMKELPSGKYQVCVSVQNLKTNSTTMECMDAYLDL